MSTSSKTADIFIEQVGKDYPQYTFSPGAQEHWSPKTNTITYSEEESAKERQYGILHELAHALLDHSIYHSDFELLKMEVEAWELAAKIGKKYSVRIDNDHIQNCLDTYRDWLHRRSACPSCGVHTMQKDAHHYKCFNCGTQWSVSSGRFSRPYRLRK